MKKYFRKSNLFLVCSVILLVSTNAYAKWWIFGKGEAVPEINRVYVAGVNVEEIEDSLTLYNESLEIGEVVIKGFT